MTHSLRFLNPYRDLSRDSAYMRAFARGLAAALSRVASLKKANRNHVEHRKVKIGIIGSQFEAEIHAASIKMASEFAEVVAVEIPRVFTDYRQLLKERDVDMITIAAPNQLHAQMTMDGARTGKHVLCEKPLAMTVEECEQMLDVCRQSGVLLLYGEELFFTPKYLKAKEMADDRPVLMS